MPEDYGGITQLFYTYESRRDGTLVLAAKLSLENFDALARVTGVEKIIAKDQDDREVYWALDFGDDRAELGDYVVCGYRDTYRPADQEVFDAQYAR